MEQKLRSEAKSLLEEGKVDRIIGFAQGSLKFTTTPLITSRAEDAERLVINPFIVNNLAGYLNSIKGKIGIAAKPCDARSIVSLIQDNQIKREDITILGIPCRGLIDIAKIEKTLNRDRDEFTDITLDGDQVTVTISSDKKTMPAVQVLLDDCLACENNLPREYDILIGEASAPICDAAQSRSRIAGLDAMTAAERWEFWKNEFSRCIRCYACRQACPSCFCERCFVEESEPRWLNAAPHWQDNLMFQLIRVLHTAGRCVDCGECERACPADIPLRTLMRKPMKDVKELYGWTASAAPAAKAPLSTFSPDDPGPGFK